MTGYYNETPMLRFVYRKNQLVSIAGEKTNEEALRWAVNEFSIQSGLSVSDYSVFADLGTSPGHYVILMEPGRIVPEDEVPHYRNIIESTLMRANPSYGEKVRSGVLQPLELVFVQQQTYLLYRDMMVMRGASPNQLKPVRVNECFAPLVSFNGLVGEKAKDVLYMPRSLGQRSPNPWAKMESFTPLDYLHNEYETSWRLHYPQCSMCWLGIESGDKFLYVARLDEQIRACFLTVRHTIHGDDLMPGVVHLPMARPGETVTFAPTAVGLLDGDWREGAKRYRAWADGAFFKVRPKAEWVKNLTGWQRIVLKSQFGENHYTFKDLPAMYEAGHKYGIDTLFLFAWWKEGMDRAYPKYEEPYPGAWAELKANIAEVRRRGGRVILECNCHMVDPASEFYKAHGSSSAPSTATSIVRRSSTPASASSVPCTARGSSPSLAPARRSGATRSSPSWSSCRTRSTRTASSWTATAPRPPSRVSTTRTNTVRASTASGPAAASSSTAPPRTATRSASRSPPRSPPTSPPPTRSSSTADSASATSRPTPSSSPPSSATRSPR